VDGHRIDYVESPDYDFLDARGTLVRRPRLAADGAVIARKRDDGSMEIIPVECKEWVGVSCDGRKASAVALDRFGRPLGRAETRLSRGLVYVVPFPDAFSYLLRPKELVEDSLSADMDSAAPGERIVLLGERTHEVKIPRVSAPGTRVWFRREGQWIDFTVSPVAAVQMEARDGQLTVTVSNMLSSDADFTIDFNGECFPQATVAPGDRFEVKFPIPQSALEYLRPIPLIVKTGGAEQRATWWLHAMDESGERTYTLHEASEEVPYQPGRYGAPNLGIDDLRSARAGWLRLEVVGCVNRDATRVRLNGVDLGPLPPTQSYFNEIKSDRYSPLYMQLPSNVIASLNPVNELVIENPGQAVFKSRGFWIELEVDNERSLSSRITSSVYTQPPGYFFDGDWHYPTNPNFTGPTRTEIQFALAQESE
jgi:hypothetical protein